MVVYYIAKVKFTTQDENFFFTPYVKQIPVDQNTWNFGEIHLHILNVEFRCKMDSNPTHFPIIKDNLSLHYINFMCCGPFFCLDFFGFFLNHFKTIGDIQTIFCVKLVSILPQRCVKFQVHISYQEGEIEKIKIGPFLCPSLYI